MLHIIPHKVYKAPKEELKMLENHDKFKRLTQYVKLYAQKLSLMTGDSDDNGGLDFNNYHSLKMRKAPLHHVSLQHQEDVEKLKTLQASDPHYNNFDDKDYFRTKKQRK